MRSIFVLLILVMIGLNGKGQSVTALPDSVLSQCCLEVTLLNGNVTTVDWAFIQYITRDGTGTKLFVEYAPNFGGIQWETQIRIQDDFDEVLERSKFIMLPFTVGSTDYAVNRNWIANIEENTTTGGTWVYGRFGTPAKRKFSAVEDYETLKNLLLACRPRAIVVAENGLYTEGDTVRMGGFLIEPTRIETRGYNWQMKDTLSSVEFGLDYNTPGTGDTTVYWGRRFGSLRQMMQMGRQYWHNKLQDTISNLQSTLTHSWGSGDPFLQYITFSATHSVWIQAGKDNSFWNQKNLTINPYYTLGFQITPSIVGIGVSESGSGDPGNGVIMGAYGFGTTEYLFMKTKAVDNNTATNGQFLQLIDNTSGEVDFATIDLSGYLEIADTAAMLAPYVTFGNLSGYPTGSGTTDRSARWSATNTLVAGNFTDNGTKVQALLPFQLHQWATAGRPTGVTGYEGYNTTGNGKEWYNGTRWAYALESTFARGTSTRIPVFDANGQITEYSGFIYSNASYGGIRITGITSPAIGLANILTFAAVNTVNDWSSGSQVGDAVFRLTSATNRHIFDFNNTPRFTISQNGLIHTSSGTNGLSITYTSSGSSTINQSGLALVTAGIGTGITVTGSDQRLSLVNGSNSVLFGQSSSGGTYFSDAVAGDGIIRATNTKNLRFGIDDGTGFSSSILRVSSAGIGIKTNAVRTLTVLGEARITDLTTDTPTEIVGADGDGDLGRIIIGTGLSFLSGTLSATGTADGNGIYTGSGSLASHTTRALVPITGNLMFSQRYNSNSDSMYFHFINGLNGDRILRGGLTDTMSTGYSKFEFYQDAGNEVMGYKLSTQDGFGSTLIRAEEDFVLITASGRVAIEAALDNEVQIFGMVRAKQEAYNEITSTSSPQTLSNVYADNLINQGGTQATFTFNLPASPEDGQISTATYNNAVTVLTYNGNGESIIGTAPTAATAGEQHKFKFYTSIGWIRQN